MKRKAISKRIRFEVFKRDSFTCQYCGQPAPDVVLELDHIIPHSKGGRDDAFNLLTSCEDCNSGKSNIPLEKKEEIRKQKAELDRLQERRNQLRMMAQWQRDLMDAKDDAVNKLCEIWNTQPGSTTSLNDTGKKGLRKLLRKFTFEELSNAIEVALEHYDEPNVAFGKLGGICRMTRLDKENPQLKDIYYIRGILRRRMNDVPWHCIKTIQQAVDSGVDLTYIRQLACEKEFWYQFERALERATEAVAR